MTGAAMPAAGTPARPGALPTTIGEVLDALDRIIDRSRRDRSRIGYFAVLYREVTANVQRGIASGRFADGPRMERLDVVFANRYLEALAAWEANRPVSRCWRVAFEAASRWPPLVLQHLLLGMNAHINLDLAIAAVDVSSAGKIHDVQGDFMEINALLGEMIDEVQRRLARISPWMGVLDFVGRRTDEEICGFCLTRARDLSWAAALQLAALPPAGRLAQTAVVDTAAAALARPIEKPGAWVSSMLLGARAREVGDVARVIDLLGDRRH